MVQGNGNNGGEYIYTDEHAAIVDFLRDAERIEDYATGCGLLPDDDFLVALETARKAESNGGLKTASKEYRVLRSELNKVLRYIHPVTLLDLKEWNPFERKRRKSDKRSIFRLALECKRWLSNMTIAVMALVIFVLTGFYTVWAQRAELLIGEIQAIENQNLVELERTYLSWLIGRVEASDDANAQWKSIWIEGASYFDEILAFEQRVQKLNRDVQRTINETHPLQNGLVRLGNYVCYSEELNSKAGDTATVSVTMLQPEGAAQQPQYRTQWLRMFCPPPRFGFYSAQATMVGPPDSATNHSTLSGITETVQNIQNLLTTYLQNVPARSQVARTTDTHSGVVAPQAAGRAPSFEFIEPKLIEPEQCEQEVENILSEVAKMLGKTDEARTTTVTLSNPEILFDVNLRNELMHLIRCARLGKRTTLNDNNSFIPSFMVENAGQLRREYRVASKWWLPSLYGALGAMVYTLGFMLSRILPDPKVFRSVVRLMMGSLAGVAIVNFFTPEIADMIYVPVKSIALLALAFLAGFSIEVVLALLRGIINRWSERVSSIGSRTS